MRPISYFRYQLKKKKNQALNAKEDNQSFREGALLRVEIEPGLYGYADLFPWPEFGDSDLDQQLELLKKDKLTPILERAIDLAERDANLREQKKSGFSDLPDLKNHFLVLDLAALDQKSLSHLKEQDFTTLKIKLGTDFEKQWPALENILNTTDFKIRLDFNSCLNWLQFDTFVKYFSLEHQPRIEYIEDPMPWNITLWKKAAQFFPLAMDLEYNRVPWNSLAEVPFKYLIFKPARQAAHDVLEKAAEFDCKIAVTSSMDHPVGVAHAALIGAQLTKKYPHFTTECGLLTSDIYQSDDFSAALKINGAHLVGPSGTGIGFDSQLESLPWLKLN